MTVNTMTPCAVVQAVSPCPRQNFTEKGKFFRNACEEREF